MAKDKSPPSFGTAKDDEVWNLILYIRGMSKGTQPAGRPRRVNQLGARATAPLPAPAASQGAVSLRVEPLDGLNLSPSAVLLCWLFVRRDSPIGPASQSASLH